MIGVLCMAISVPFCPISPLSSAFVLLLGFTPFSLTPTCTLEGVVGRVEGGRCIFMAVSAHPCPCAHLCSCTHFNSCTRLHLFMPSCSCAPLCLLIPTCNLVHTHILPSCTLVPMCVLVPTHDFFIDFKQ